MFSPSLLPHVDTARQTYATTDSGTSNHICRISTGALASLRHSVAGADATGGAHPVSRQRLRAHSVSRAPIGNSEQRCSRAPHRRWQRGDASGFAPIAGSAGSQAWQAGSTAIIRNSHSRLSMPTTTACPSGSPVSIISSRRLKLERLFLGRHKVYHYRIWYRDVLANYVKEMLLDSRTLSRPYLERSGVEAHRARPSQGQSQLHHRDSPAALAGTDPAAFPGTGNCSSQNREILIGKMPTDTEVQASRAFRTLDAQARESPEMPAHSRA